VTAPSDTTPEPQTPPETRVVTAPPTEPARAEEQLAEPEPPARSVWGVLFVLGVLGLVAGFLFWVANALTVRELRRFEGHTGIINAVAFTPDGRLGLSAGEDNTVRVWDLETGDEVQKFTRPVAPVKDVAVLPDGKTAVSADVQTLRVWDPATGKEIDHIEGHQGALTSVAVTPDGKYALLGSRNDRNFQLWPLDQKRLYVPRQVYRGHTGWVNSISLSRDGKTAASGGDTTVRLWDVESGKMLHCLMGHKDTVKSVALSPDGRRVVSASMDGTVRLWDAETGKELRRFEGHASWVMSVAFAPDGRRVATGGEGLVRGLKKDNFFEKYTVRVWDVETGAELLHFQGGDGAVRGVAFSPDGTRLLSGGDDRVLRLWRIP
jgi:WD40 repeat protein